ncbi:MAG: hypothetical protein Ct9H90mP16_19090 [Candidatus Poseidoniales archaeon]|jgi:hypothetical protein|nr:MAG: hypothetical protein Ct9H90mP16_19090 [Candidatus Poseidoniales archaeon]|tara:strand:- start:1031 stop:1711 length:681 start_codon:yes stop_codon:yes gene_type:complete
MSTLKGPVRFRFRQPESDVDVMIQGDAEWVQALREDLGLGDVGWIQPMATTGHSVQVSQSDEESVEDGEMTDDESPVILQSDTTSSLPGPPPDPSRIPVVRRVIGDMDLDAEMEKLGIEHPRSPTAEELSDLIAEMDEPEPIMSQVSTDPIAEAWLQRLMRVAVRKFGVTALPVEVIDSSACEQLERSGMELELWLEGMWRLGKLVKVHGGGSYGYGPSPRWLEAD